MVSLVRAHRPWRRRWPLRFFAADARRHAALCLLARSLGALVFVPPVGGLIIGFILSLIVLITAVTYMILHCVGQDVKTVPLLSLCGVNCSCNFCCGAEVNTSGGGGGSAVAPKA